MKTVLALLGFLALVVTAEIAPAEDHSLPPRLIGFLEPGMYVGIQNESDSGSVSLSVYSTQAYEAAKSLSIHPDVEASDFADAHPDWAGYVLELNQEPARKTLDIKVRGARRILLGRIVAIGADYLLVELNELNATNQRPIRRVISERSVSTIELNTDPADFHWVERDSKVADRD